ncbi:MAG: HYR domain-containing protein [Woeseiaceae bacterium]
MTIWRATCSILTVVFALTGCVREEEALLDNQSDPIGNGGDALSIAPPAAMSSEATGPTTMIDIGQATASGGDGNYSFSHDAPAGGFGLGSTTVNWTVQDGAGATAGAAQNVTVSDSTPPTVSRPADMQVQSTGMLTMVDIGAATATDLVDSNPTVSNDMPAAGFPMGATPVTWTATDASGNVATAVQMVTVAAPTGGPLTITAPAAVSAEATAPLSLLMLGAATVTGGEPPMTINNDAPANGFPVGQTTVTWAVTDNAMTTMTATQQVTVVDSTPPQLTAPAGITADQGPGLGDTSVTLGNASASDIADPSPLVSNDAPANGFPVGTTTVTWTAMDAYGNSSTATQTVTINAYVAEQCSAVLTDFQNTIYPLMNTQTPPRCVGCHTGTITPVVTPNNFAFLNDPPTAADFDTFRTVALMDVGNQSLILDKVRGGSNHTGGDLFPNGLGDPDFVALSDFVSRARNCVTALQITAPAAVSTEATGPLTNVTIGNATAMGGDGAYSFSDDAPAAGFGLGTTVVNWTVQDGAGATATATQDVTVSDTTAPTIAAPADVQADSTGTLTIVNIGTATATDLVDSNPTISNNAPAGGFPEGVTSVIWTGTDASGNAATATQMVTVSPPSSGPLAITAPANVSQEATAPLSVIALGAANVTGGTPPVSISDDAPAGGFPVGQTMVTWTATDSAMMTATATQQVTVIDSTAPQLTVPADVTADQGPALGNTDVNLGTASASDIADPNPTISNDAPAGGFPVGTTTVTWTAQDAFGNSSVATQSVTINAYVVEQCSALVPDFQNTIYPIMDSTSPPRCNGCHTGTATPRVTPNGFAFLNDPPTANDFEIFRTVARIDSGNESLILVKVRGGLSHTGGDLFPSGTNDPDFVELANFVSRARNCQDDSGGGSETVMLGTGYEQLHRIVSTLGSRTPTQDEINLVATANDQAAIDVALDPIIDGLMNETAFYTRVKEMYNDLLLTDKDADDRGNPVNNYDLDAFANRDYYDDNFSGGERNDLFEMANWGISRAPLALIEYVITNNRPFTEVLTADYVMVNPYSAVIYGVDAGDNNFPFSSDNNQANHDREDFRPVSNIVQSGGDQVPLAGIIGTHAFLARYPSTNTNINRKRASFVFDYFLGIDIESLAARDGLDLDNVIGSVPTYEDPQCTVCHDVMDPIAGLFTKRDNDGEYDQGNTYRHNQTTNGVPRMVPAGYSLNAADELPTAEEDQPLKWLVQRLAADDRFANRTVRTVFKGLTGIEATAPSTIAFINDTKNDFRVGNFDFKALVKSIVMSDYYRARNLDPAESPANYMDIGAGRILTPEELDRRIRSVAGGGYDWNGPNSGSGLDGRHYMLYGGINSDDVDTRTTSPTSLMDGIQERIANQVACERVATDLYNSGNSLLFPIAAAGDTPDTGPGEDAIRQNIVHLHRHLLGEERDVNDAEVAATYQLFVDTRALGETAIPSQCRGGGGSTDTNGTVLPWMAVVTYLLSDYQFLYE